MNKRIRFYENPQVWFSSIFVSIGLVFIGWAISYPINFDQVSMPVLEAVSPLFWVGIFWGFVGLTGSSLTSSDSFIQWLCCVLVVLLLSAPHFLYIAWGSDAGSLANMSAYAKLMETFNFERDFAVNSYYQWPSGIFFSQFIADLLNVDVYVAAAIVFVIACVSVSSGLFLLWYSRLDEYTRKQSSVFWGVVVYFAGFYWLLNWQSAPYVFALVFFIPSLALLERNNWKVRLLFLLLVLVGLESHALFGIWLIMILAAYLFVSFFKKSNKNPVSISILMIVLTSQITLILYKNVRFFKHLVLNLKGYYTALMQTDASDKVLVAQVNSALSVLPQDTSIFDVLLKSISFLDLAFLGTAIIAAAIFAIINKRLRILEISFLFAGIAYFIIGMLYAAIGMRSIQLIALVPSYFVVYSISVRGKWHNLILVLCVIGLLLFPAAIIRSHQNSQNFVTPADLAFYNFINHFQEEVQNSTGMIFSEGIRPVDFRINHLLISPTTIGFSGGCNGRLLFIDSPQLRNQLSYLFRGASKHDIDIYVNEINPSVVYDNGHISLRIGGDCTEIIRVFVP